MSASRASEKQREQREQWEQFSKVLSSCGFPRHYLFPSLVPADASAGTDSGNPAGATRANWCCPEHTRHARMQKGRA